MPCVQSFDCALCATPDSLSTFFAHGLRRTVVLQIATMKRVNHPNCVMLYEVFDEPSKTYLVLDL